MNISKRNNSLQSTFRNIEHPQFRRSTTDGARGDKKFSPDDFKVKSQPELLSHSKTLEEQYNDNGEVETQFSIEDTLALGPDSKCYDGNCPGCYVRIPARKLGDLSEGPEKEFFKSSPGASLFNKEDYVHHTGRAPNRQHGLHKMGLLETASRLFTNSAPRLNKTNSLLK